MKDKTYLVGALICALLSSQLAGCATSAITPPPPRAVPPAESKLVEMAVLTTSAYSVEIPPKSRIVIADIAGDCSVELKNALTRRLVDNANYEVLSRDNLEQIIIESKNNWAGGFNTETAVKLGRLLGASLFVVGQVVYCGPSGGYQYRNRPGEPTDIFAVLQIIDPETGKVILSSANEGKYIPETEPLSLETGPAKNGKPVASEPVAMAPVPLRPEGSEASPGGIKGIMERYRQAIQNAQQRVAQQRAAQQAAMAKATKPDAEKKKGESINYEAFKAAEELANGFADKFFSRPTWEKVEMFHNADWNYGKSVRLVKLGNCPKALAYLEREAAPEIGRLPEKLVAEYLHNYGVVLLCADQPQRAMDKLRSAYRVGNHQSTLKMLGLAAKAVEWSLGVEVDIQPEVGLLVNRRM